MRNIQKMNGTLENEIINFIISKEEFFISVLDKFKNNISQLINETKLYPFLENNKISSIILITDDNKLYFYINEKYNNDLVKVINESNLFSVYGKSEIIKKIFSHLNKSITYYNEYYIMELKRENFKLFINNIYTDYYCRRCNLKDFKKLKELQVMYHLEEVYKSPLIYPEKAEMKAFKNILKNRVVYAVYSKKTKNFISKVNVNAETEKTIQIGGVYTRKEYRREGFSYFCLNNFLKEIFLNKERVLLFVNKNNNPAINLYLKLGFKIIDESILCYF